MTRVVGVRKVEDCIDGSVIKEVHLDCPLDESLMRRLAGSDALEFFPHFPRPYFQVRRHRAYLLQGVLGSHSFRATLLPNSSHDTERLLIAQAEDDTPLCGSQEPQ